LRGWLATIARSRALDRVRSGKRRQAAHERAAVLSEEGAAVGMSASEPADEGVLRVDARASLERALAMLSAEQRRALELAYFGGLSQSEIAAELGEPLGTVKTRLRDGMGKLRERFGVSRGSRT
jgi:RNA polymerase sigma-70 factor (ECF subfamily)